LPGKLGGVLALRRDLGVDAWHKLGAQSLVALGLCLGGPLMERLKWNRSPGSFQVA